MDYCTLWFEGWWAHCCEAHDSDYSAQIGQVVADGKLLACVASSLPGAVVDNPVLALGAGIVSGGVGLLMWAGVRLFGRRFYRRAGEEGKGDGV